MSYTNTPALTDHSSNYTYDTDYNGWGSRIHNKVHSMITQYEQSILDPWQPPATADTVTEKYISDMEYRINQKLQQLAGQKQTTYNHTAKPYGYHQQHKQTANYTYLEAGQDHYPATYT